MLNTIIGIAIGFVAMLILRPLFLWYWKIYETLDKQEELIDELKRSQKEVLQELKKINLVKDVEPLP